MSLKINGVNLLETQQFFAGTTLTYEYEFVHPDGTKIDLTIEGIAAIWQLCPFMHFDYPVLEKALHVDRALKNVAFLRLTSEETKGLLEEKYTQQIFLEWGGNRYRQTQGNILVIPHIANMN